MIWNEHSKLNGLHAFLSPSNSHWLRYSDNKLATVYHNRQAVEMGTRLHAYASEAIKLGRKQPKTKDTVSLFINDAIRYKMESEQILYYSPYCFGTTDAICFNDGLLRIHDLKTGESEASMDQLDIYAGLFCLEYGIDPDKIDCELRIYQYDEVKGHIPVRGEIRDVMDIIVHASSILESLQDRR